MAVKKPVLTVMNPILLALYRAGWEEPDWGTSSNQVSIALAIRDLAAVLEDPRARKEIQSAAAKALTTAAQTVVKESA